MSLSRTGATILALRRIASDAAMIEEQSVAEWMSLPVDHPDVVKVLTALQDVREKMLSRAQRLALRESR